MTWDALFVGKVLYTTVNGIAGIDTRIYPMRVPQNIDLSTTAAISYYIISTRPEATKDSRSMVDTVRIQVSIFSTSYSSVNLLAQSVRDVFDGLTGEVAGCSVDGCYFDDESDIFEDEHQIYHKVQEYIIRVKNGASTNTSDKVISFLNLSSDTTLTGVIPAGFLIEYMVFDETAGKTAQLSAGTTATDNNIMNQEAISAGALTVVNVNKIFSKTAATTIYLSHSQPDDTWNGATINLYIQLRKIT